MAQANSKIFINVLIGLLVVVAGVLSYFYFTQQGSSTDVTVVQTGAPIITVNVSPEAQQIIARLNELNAIKLDKNIIDNPIFGALEDFSVPIAPESTGVSNPFQKTNF
jgi:hypothetical protein